jgi:hypothetical protein
MKKRIENRIKILSILGIDRTSVDTIARNSADFVTNLVILSNLTSLAIVENCPAVVRDKTMIAKSKQFQGSRK